VDEAGIKPKMLKEYVPLKAEFEYVVCAPTAGGFVIGLEPVPLEPPHPKRSVNGRQSAK
jgi:hypothetical protein